MDIPFNINRYVKVKLTEEGKRLHKEDKETFYREYLPHLSYTYEPPEEDAEGYSKWQLWTLMREFGKHIVMGTEPPFGIEIIIVKECQDVFSVFS